VNIYIFVAIIAVAELLIFLKFHNSKVKPERLMFFIMGVVACAGYVVITRSSNLDAAIIGNDIYNVGGLSCCISLVLIVADLCQIKVKDGLKYYMLFHEFVTLCFIFTVKYNDLYYKSMEVGFYNGIYFLIKDRGAMHVLASIMIIGVNLICIGFVVYSWRNRKSVSYRTLTILLAMEISSTIIYFIPRVLGRPFDITVIAYAFDMACMLIIFRHADMYDMQDNLTSVYNQRSEYGYLCFDKKKKFMGASDALYRVVPELAVQRLDRRLNTDLFKTVMPVEIVNWSEAWIDGIPGTPQERQFSQNGKYWDASIREIRGAGKDGFLVEFHDDTRDMIHISEIEQEREKVFLAKKEADAANAQKSAFLSIVSHEIRTPMNAVVGMTELLLRDDDSLNEKQKTYLQNICSSGQSLITIVNDILDHSKIEAGKMEIIEDVYELRPIIDDVKLIIENRIAQKPIELKVSIDDKIPAELVGDGLRLRQILINLMNNSVKFTEKGHISLDIKCLGINTKGCKLKYVISDSGQGIAKEDLERLGKAFAQVDTKKNHGKEGTGLGLSISRDFISLMGGTLEVNSVYGEGSEFFFSIYQKLPDENEPEKECYKEEELITGNEVFTAPRARILIVDDTEINLWMTEEMLSPIECHIDTAPGGEQAIEMVRSNHYDLVFMDYVMPGMDGVEATKCIREFADATSDIRNGESAEYYSDIPIIALTGDVTVETRDKFKEAGINDFAEKPVSTKVLKIMLLKHLPKEYIIVE